MTFKDHLARVTALVTVVFIMQRPTERRQLAEPPGGLQRPSGRPDPKEQIPCCPLPQKVLGRGRPAYGRRSSP